MRCYKGNARMTLGGEEWGTVGNELNQKYLMENATLVVC